MAREPHRSSEILDAVALLVVDMQDAFLNVMPDRDAVLRRTALAIEAARAFGIKVIFTEQAPAKLGPTHADLLALAPEARVFAKNEFSALLAEGLQEYLRRINVYHLLLAGIETPICIYQTALHAQDNDLDVTLLSDCTTGRRPEDCVIVMEALSRAECHVLPAETVFYSMLGSSLNPRFAHFTRIVKRYMGDEPIGGGPTPAPEGEARPDAPAGRGEGQRHGDRDRQRGGRHGDTRGGRQDRGRDGQGRGGPRDRHPGKPDVGQRAEEAAADLDEDTRELLSEDGISEAEANQPSYEEATAEHSGVEPALETPGSEPSGDSSGTALTPPEPVDTDDVPSTDEATEDGESTDEDAGETEGVPGEEGPRKKRGRRRRGGARRRRARERAAAAANDGTVESTDADTSEPPAPEDAASAGSETPEPKEGGAPSPTPDGPPVP